MGLKLAWEGQCYRANAEKDSAMGLMLGGIVLWG